MVAPRFRHWFASLGATLLLSTATGCPGTCLDCIDPDAGPGTSDESGDETASESSAGDAGDGETGGDAGDGGTDGGASCSPSAECDACVDSMCEELLNNCEADATCNTILQCIDAETTAGTCDLLPCYETQSNIFTDIQMCISTLCGDAC